MFGGATRALDRASEKRPDLFGRRLAAKNGRSHQAARIVIDDHRHPPAERPALRQRQRRPGNPEPAADRHGRQIDVPDVVGTLCGHTAGDRFGSVRLFRRNRKFGFVLEDSADGRGRQVESGPGERFANLPLAKRGTESLEAPDDMADKVGNLLTGSRACTSASGPWSSSRFIQAVIVTA